MPTAKEQNRGNGPQQKKQKQQHALDTVGPEQHKKRRSDHPQDEMWDGARSPRTAGSSPAVVFSGSSRCGRTEAADKHAAEHSAACGVESAGSKWRRHAVDVIVVEHNA